MGQRLNGLIARLRDYTRKPLCSYGVHCMAHKLHLAITHSYRTTADGYFESFEAFINSIHTFYNNQGHKRKAHLRMFASQLKLTQYETSYIYQVRWISSELTALDRIRKMLKDATL